MKKFSQFLNESYFLGNDRENFKIGWKTFATAFSSAKEIIDHLKKINGLNGFETKISGDEITFHLNHSKDDDRSEWKNKNNIQLFPSLTITLKVFNNNEVRVVGFDLYNPLSHQLGRCMSDFFERFEKSKPKKLFDFKIIKYEFDVAYTDAYHNGKFSGKTTKCYLNCYQCKSNEGLEIKTDVELAHIANTLARVFHSEVNNALQFTGQRLRSGASEI